MTGRRREQPAPLPGIARIRIVADDEATERIVNVLRAYFTCTDASDYSGGRSYLDVDTRPSPPSHPEAV